MHTESISVCVYLMSVSSHPLGQPQTDDHGKGGNNAAVIGGVVGAILGAAIIALVITATIIMLLWRKCWGRSYVLK